MHDAPACPPDDYLQAIALARLILPPEIHLQAPPNLSDDFGPLLDAGIDDWGGVSPVTADHVNPERPWPALDRLREVTEARGFALAPRLTIYPEHVLDPERWLDPACASRCSTAAMPRASAATTPVASSPSRSRRRWRQAPAPRSCRSAAATPPGTPARRWHPSPLVPGLGRLGWHGPVGEVLDGVLLGQEVGEDEITTLFSARGAEVAAVAQVADELRRAVVGDVVTYVRNRNINYTNVCTFKCRFCGFSKGPLSLNLRGTPVPAHARGHPGPGARGAWPTGPPRCASRAASTPTSTATTTSTWPGRCTTWPPRSTSTASPPSRSPRAPSASASRWPTTCAA